MKLEIEITEAEIKSALERKVRVAIAEQATPWASEQKIRDTVKAHWNQAMESLVADLIGNHSALKALVEKAVEARVKDRVAKALKSI